MAFPSQFNAGQVILDLQQPDPVDSIEEYTLKRVLMTREYAVFRLTEHPGISQVSQLFFRVLLSACDTEIKAYLSKRQDGNQEARLRRIQKFEASIRSRPWLHQVPDQEQQRAVEELVRARRVQLYERYWDYLLPLWEKLQRSVQENLSEQRRLLELSNHWSDILIDVFQQARNSQERRRVKLEENKEAGTSPVKLEENKEEDTSPVKLEENEETETSTVVPPPSEDKLYRHLRALERAARIGGIDTEQALAAVIAFGGGNTLINTNLTVELETCGISRVKQTLRMLQNDLMDVNSAVRVEMKADRICLTAVIQHLIARWRSGSEIDNPERWGASDEFYHLYVLPAERGVVLAPEQASSSYQLTQHGRAWEAERARELEELEQTLRPKQKAAKEKLLGDVEALLEQYRAKSMPLASVTDDDIFAALESQTERAERASAVWDVDREFQLQCCLADTDVLGSDLQQIKRFPRLREECRSALKREPRKYAEAGSYYAVRRNNSGIHRRRLVEAWDLYRRIESISEELSERHFD